MGSAEKLANFLNGRVWWLTYASGLLFFLGLWVVNSGEGDIRQWGFVVVAFGVLLGSLAIFSELFAPKEETFEGRHYVRVSKAARAGELPAYFAMAFFGAWFVGWCVVAVLLAWKIAGSA